MTASSVKTSAAGYPRIGYDREWKKALEQYWAKKISAQELEQELDKIELQRLANMHKAGLDYIPVNDYSWYDHVLDMTTMFGLIPSRYSYEGGEVSPDLMFALARGTQDALACEMTKWFNTNYHYIVPEWEGRAPQLTANRPLQAYRKAKLQLGIEGKPVIIGPYTYVRSLKGVPAGERLQVLKQFISVYSDILRELEAEGVPCVQLDEPAFVLEMKPEDWQAVQSVYEQLRTAAPSLPLWVQTYFDAVSDYEAFVQLPVNTLGLDFVHGKARNEAALRKSGFPQDKTLALGVIDGRNIWRTDLLEAAVWLESVASIVPQQRWIVQPSCSLLHVPLTATRETELPEAIRHALAFADEKLEETVQLARHIAQPGEASRAVLDDSAASVLSWRNEPSRQRAEVVQALHELLAEEKAKGIKRTPYEERRVLHAKRWPELPLLPTTTIGSMPQTADIRRARLRYRKGEWDANTYETFLEEEMTRWIRIQEDIGIDVLVHGEFERTDMVEYFGEKLDGFAFTKFGWVQSYGSRCVKPPVLYGDVAFKEPMTVKETAFAQSLTAQPVKGMLTGPVTILNWSFVRNDVPREQAAFQLAYALRQEIAALEQAGIGMIQVDEPAVKEGMPLKAEDASYYTEWAVLAFRLATCGAKPQTQIHTHMCYCDFSDMVDTIRKMDADVISLETARSGGDMIATLEKQHYELGIGLGVYDIHSPRVPSVEEMKQLIEQALAVLPVESFWINPDCGLKTRHEPETVAALRHMVEATKQVRQQRGVAEKQPLG
ncbi:5-methyltetrahydropteroyltriglutamate--homocysteine S-methyltransferase [Paenibacillus apiarius]|uniref:5-methyltetrahydropteroyltriglutamate-- homocysteine S-methyltransferase n=1 Tax=Paenibacillus apiarius TaxID=46240 RepID=UPI00197DBC89|nr:5-methyltetrahydropteroyltriglutamate--homocysteine S-methyltransferase [Paenibacillus apiarius]MBN3526303.1 5-methyltetrahydropteroyltriglutamate--homocysteine S-methyltransferase [Paenibacillus apiarius]